MSKQRRNGHFASPVNRRRLSLALVVLGALIAGAGAAMRSSSQSGSGLHSASYLVDVVAWLIVIAGAIIEVLASSVFFQFDARRARRRALLLAIIGVIAAISGCYLASAVFDSDAPALLSGVAYGVLVGGIGAGLGGLFSLGWWYGGAYAAGRIGQMGEEDW